MASSSNQKLADELRYAVDVFEGEPVSSSSVEWLLGRVREIAHHLAPPAGTQERPLAGNTRRLRAVR